MELALDGMPLVLVALVVAAALVLTVVLLVRRRVHRRAAPVAHSERLTALPRFRRMLVLYRVALVLLVGVIAAGLVATGLLAGRPVDAQITRSTTYTRDIVLCLDVSGSMVEYDAEVLRQFESLADEFAGERLALVLWSSSAVTTFPLTDDYEYVRDQLGLVRESMERSVDGDYGGYPYWNGTLVAEGASLIGDGLASCVMSFDRLDSRRSRTVILATDNVVNGEPIVTLQEAGDYASERGVRVFAINPETPYTDREARNLEKVAESTDGGYYALEDSRAVPRIVDGLLEDQATEFHGAPVLTYTDVPQAAYGWAVAAFLLLLLMVWRLRL